MVVINNQSAMEMSKAFAAHGVKVSDGFDPHMIQLCKPQKAASSLEANPHFSQAICCNGPMPHGCRVGLEKHPRHTASMPPGVFLHPPCIRATSHRFATIFVRNAG